MRRLRVPLGALLTLLLLAGLAPVVGMAAVGDPGRATLQERCERLDEIEQRAQRTIRRATREIRRLRAAIEADPADADEYRAAIAELRQRVRRVRARVERLQDRCAALNPAPHPRIYLPSERARLRGLLERQAPSAVRFAAYTEANLERSFQELWDSDTRMWSLALMGNLTRDARYCRKAVDGIEWFVRGEEERIAVYDPADRSTLPVVARDSYLEIGPLVGDVMLVLDWCHRQTTSEQRQRWLRYADRAVWNVWNPEDATWAGREAAWSGWSIDNPSNNYYYSFLRATMLVGLAGEGELATASRWRRFFRTTKIAEQLVPTFEADLAGGGSREGTGYGTAMMRLWEIYDLWETSTGEDIAGLTGHTRASLVQFLHYVVPTRDYVALTGDHSRDSTGALFDYHRHYGQALARLVADDGPESRALAGRVRRMLDASAVPEMQNGFMLVYDFLYDLSDIAYEPPGELNTAYYAAGAGQVFARSSWEPGATWLGVVAGPYTESHAHRDQGSFTLYRRGWMAFDPNFFSHSGIRQEEEFHNLVRLERDGATVVQRPGTAGEVTALHQGDGWLHVATDTTSVYGDNAGPGAAVRRVQRELVFVAPDVVVVFDRVTTAPGVEPRWQLNVPSEPTVEAAGFSIEQAGSTMTVRQLVPASADTRVIDWTADPDVSGGFRVETAVPAGANTFLHVLDFDGAVVSAVRSDAGGRQGVAMVLADGRTVTIRFSTSAVDTILEIEEGTGAGVHALGPGLDTLPELTPSF